MRWIDVALQVALAASIFGWGRSVQRWMRIAQASDLAQVQVNDAVRECLRAANARIDALERASRKDVWQ